MATIRVTDPSEPRVADYLNLRDRDLWGRELFMAESEVVLRILARQRHHAIRSVLIAEQKLAALEPFLAGREPEVELLVAAQPVLDAILGFHLHRGVLALGVRGPVPTLPAWLERLPAGPCTVVLLEALTNHDNVGGVLRNAAAFGAAAVILDPATCDPLYRKAIRVSVGAALLVPHLRCDSVPAALPLLHAVGFTSIALTPAASARDLRELRGRVPQRVALLLGTEGTGLSAAALATAHERARVVIVPDFDSLNVATTAGIALFELCA